MIFGYEEECAQAEKVKKKLLTVYIAVAAAFVAAVLLLLFLSTDHYTPFMVANILLSIAFGFYSVWFFTVKYDFAVKRYRFLNKVSNALEEKEFAVFLKEEEMMTIDGVGMRILLFDILGTVREAHLFESNFAPEQNKKYLIVMRAGVIVKMEECNE